MRWLLAMLLMVSFVACGGGDDGAADTATATVAEVRPTTSPSPIATTVPIPTSMGSPLAFATRPGGSGVRPVGTTDTGAPTPTRRPVTVVTTPRPIARTPTPPISFAFATATPVPDDDGITVVIDDTFDDPATTAFFIGETDYGTVATVENGRYSLTVQEGAWQSMTVTSTGDLSNAAILVDAGIQGDGAVGVVGRSVSNDDGTWTFYVCWLSTDGRAGCHVSISSEWVELFSVAAGAVQILEVNALYLSVDGDEVYFEANDISIGTINDGSSITGTWGVFAESYTGTSVIWFDRATIVTLDE